MDGELRYELKRAANTIRQLSMEAIQKAESGHPGLPLGCAEIGAYLYGHALVHNPKDSKWMARDRFLLSAGHGSMLLYSCLHLAGFDLPMEDIKNFRQLYSQAPGHPEYSETDGVEITSGPLGQGVANAVGLALGCKILAAKFNTDDFTLFNNKIYCLAGDGCMMEGVSAEASSLAGHLNLNNLILIYDSNKISLDGPLDESCSEDTAMRYKAYGWDVCEVDGHDIDALDEAVSRLRQHQTRPALIIAHTVIGHGAPNKAGSHKAHGAPLGVEEVAAAKKALNLPEEEFHVPQSIRRFFEHRLSRQAEIENSWNETFRKWASANPDLHAEYVAMRKKTLPEDLETALKALDIKSPIASRTSSNEVLGELDYLLPFLYGGSADLSSSDMTLLKKYGVINANDFTGRNIKFGVREFAMGAIANGLFHCGSFVPFIGTFLVFSDYMRNAIRIAAMSYLQVVYQFTHDSFYVGEDGPTHQPVEHIAALRAIPHLQVIRPADSNEVKMAWLAALKYKGPTALILSRQALPKLEQTSVTYSEGVGRGAYILQKEKNRPDVSIFATGSEVSLALEVARELVRMGKDVRVVSFPCFELFEQQCKEYQESIVGGDLGLRVSIEAAIDQGWHKYIGREGLAVCMESFGLSAPARDLAVEFGFKPEAIVEQIIGRLA